MFNGEIYNYRELRVELEAMRLCTSSTDSDTEVHPARLAAHGATNCLDRICRACSPLRSVRCRRIRALWLARDRLGVKPLFYAELGDGTVLFGSELKALLAHPALAPRAGPDRRSRTIMGLGYVPDDACIVAGREETACRVITSC